MKDSEKTLIVGIVEKKFFKYRVVKDNTALGGYLYDFYINLLKASGKEIKGYTPHQDVRLFTQAESSHKVRYFKVPEKVGIVIQQYCWISMRNALNSFAKDMRKEGSNLLMQLNSGELTIRDFDDTLKQDH